jgi:hypothetical protein
MAKTVLTPEEGAELRKLQQDYIAATARTAAAIGVSEEAFVKADAETAAIVRRIKEILGTSGQHWMG